MSSPRTSSSPNTPQIVGLRFQRHDTVRLATLVGPLLALDDVVLAEFGGQRHLATVCIPSSHLLTAPSSAVQGAIVAVGLASPEVKRALEEINRATVDLIRALAGMPTTITRASWSTDFARISVSFAPELPSNLDDVHERIAAAAMAQVVPVGPTSLSLSSVSTRAECAE